MKKLSLTVKTFMACALVAAAASCSKQEAAPAAAPVAGDSTACAGLKIAYIDADSIMSAVNAYNAQAGYDAILMRESGVYFNPSLNVTSDIIEILNSRYTTAK